MPGLLKTGFKDENQARAWDTEVGWLEDLYRSQEKKKLNYHLLSFEVVNPQIHSCLLFRQP